jgi:hypothetical protein
LGANTTKTFLFQDDETQKASLTIVSFSNDNKRIYKNLFYKIIWQKED